MKKQENKSLLKSFKKEALKKPEIIKGGPETARGTVTTVQSGDD